MKWRRKVDHGPSERLAAEVEAQKHRVRELAYSLKAEHAKNHIGQRLAKAFEIRGRRADDL